jgi:hypothetical protein
LRSDSGVIRAVLLGDRWRNGSGLHSDSGAVTAIIPSTANVRVSARTCGLLQSKIPNIDRVSRGRCSRAAGRLGTGRSRLEISSETGPVVIQAWIPLNR